MKQVENSNFEELVKSYKEKKPEYYKKTYVCLNVGDIVRTGKNDYWIVYPSRSELIETGIFIPFRKVINNIDNIIRIPGGKHGIQTFKCSEPVERS